MMATLALETKPCPRMSQFAPILLALVRCCFCAPFAHPKGIQYIFGHERRKGEVAESSVRNEATIGHATVAKSK